MQGRPIVSTLRKPDHGRGMERIKLSPLPWDQGTKTKCKSAKGRVHLTRREFKAFGDDVLINTQKLQDRGPVQNLLS